MKTQIETYPEDLVSVTEEAPVLVRGNLRPNSLHVNVKIVLGFHDTGLFLSTHTPSILHTTSLQ